MYRILKWMRHLLPALLCFCLALPAGDASAEEIVVFGSDGYDLLVYWDTLSDGRILLCGAQAAPGGVDEASARLVCLNPDMTVSWEYVDPACDGGKFARAQELADGTIGVVYCREHDTREEGWALRFFTPDGMPTGKEISIAEDASAVFYMVTSSRLFLEIRKTGSPIEYRLIDWDGNETEGLSSLQMRIRGMIDEPDGLVFAGDSLRNPPEIVPVILKTDLQCNVLMERPMYPVWADSEDVEYLQVAKTADGGYLCLQTEFRHPGEDGEGGERNALVKLDSRGTILWTGTAGLENVNQMCWMVVLDDGRMVLSYAPAREDRLNVEMDFTQVFIWFDENGQNLGRTELDIIPEYFRRLDQYRKTEPGKEELVPLALTDTIIQTQNGLWLTAIVCLAEPVTTIMDKDSFDAVLIRIPEP